MSVQDIDKQAIIAKYSPDGKTAGFVEVQVALLTARINELSKHLKVHVKDNHVRRGLLKSVSRRKRLLAYLKRKSAPDYHKLIERLSLRK